MIKPKKEKLHKCKAKGCETWYRKWSSTQKACSGPCALQIAQEETAKKKREAEKRDRRELKERKLALKSRGEWMKEAQDAFNWFIRLRDYFDPCISCGRHEWEIKHDPRGGKWDAGHYRSRGAATHLRFDEDNCHKQCKYCNDRLDGNTDQYRIRLVKKIGLARVEALEHNHTPARHRIADYQAVKKEYSRRARVLKKEIDQANTTAGR